MTPVTDTSTWTQIADDWADSPVTVEHATVSGGITTAVLHARDRRLFCKTAPLSDPAAIQALHIEAAATSVHQQAAAPFHGLHQGHGWAALLFDVVDGEHPRFHPPDTALVLAGQIADLIKTPSGIATGTLPSITDRIDTAPSWATLCNHHPCLVPTAARDFLIDGQDPRMRQLDGDHVAHTDIHPYNVIVNEQEITVVDWGWAAMAPAWLDQAVIGIQLIGAGARVDSVVRNICDDRTGHPCGRDELRAFAVEMARYWIGRELSAPGATHVLNLVYAASQVAQCLGSPAIVRAPSI